MMRGEQACFLVGLLHVHVGVSLTRDEPSGLMHITKRGGDHANGTFL